MTLSVASAESKRTAVQGSMAYHFSFGTDLIAIALVRIHKVEIDHLQAALVITFAVHLEGGGHIFDLP